MNERAFDDGAMGADDDASIRPADERRLTRRTESRPAREGR
jgi:hypothetical protein